jgi:hypothetical protein
MNKCSEQLDSRKCDLVIDGLTANFGGFMPKVAKQVPMLHHNVEIKARCIACERNYWFTVSDLKIEDFGQIWRTAVFSKQFKPE